MMDRDVKFNFEGKKFVITGASGGLGKCIVSEISGSGGTVLAIARNGERLKRLAEEYPGHVVTASMDVRDYDGVEAAVRGFVAEHGKINGACHAAGTLLVTPLKAYDEAAARELADINFWSGIKLVQLCSRKKYAQNSSSYVLIASVCAYKGEAAQFALNASKASLQVAARTLAKELYRQGSRINTVSPGLIMTELTRNDFGQKGISESIIDKHLLGLGKPEDISGMVCYLLSGRAKWITGQDFVLDGGYLVSD